MEIAPSVMCVRVVSGVALVLFDFSNRMWWHRISAFDQSIHNDLNGLECSHVMQNEAHFYFINRKSV